MCTEKSKTVATRLRHGKAMVAVAVAIFIAIFNAILDPETLKFLDSSTASTGFTYRLVIWGVSAFVALWLLLDGLKQVDLKCTSKNEISDCDLTQGQFAKNIEYLVEKIQISQQANTICGQCFCTIKTR